MRRSKPHHITLMTLGGTARWKRQQCYWFQGDLCPIITRMWCDADEPNNLEYNKYEHRDGFNGSEDETVSISMDDRQRSPILDELSA